MTDITQQITSGFLHNVAAAYPWPQGMWGLPALPESVKWLLPIYGACIPPQIITSMPSEDPERLLLVASTRLPQRDGCPRRFKLSIRRLGIPDFAGPGGFRTSTPNLRRPACLAV